MIRSTKHLFALIGGFALMLAGGSYANAVPIDYSFTVTATSGPLAGDTENGTFTYDSSSIVAGGINNNAGLLTALNFTWNAISYNQTTANTGALGFDAEGNLTLALFGNNCVSGACINAPNTNDWTVGVGLASGLVNEFIYNTPQSDTTFFNGTASFALVPEPSTLAMLGVGIFGLMLIGGARQHGRNWLPG